MWVNIVDTGFAQILKAESTSPFSSRVPFQILVCDLLFFLMLSFVIQVAPITFLSLPIEWQLKNLLQKGILICLFAQVPLLVEKIRPMNRRIWKHNFIFITKTT